LEADSAEGLAKETGAIVEFRVGATEKGKGVMEMLRISGGEGGALEGGRGGKDFGLVGVEVDAIFGTLLDETGDVEGEVGEREVTEGVIDVAGTG
jgi:hypothetical protein